MAERRMFTKKITDDDHFSQMAASAQALYLHLSMSADDDGFCNQVSTAMFKAHASVSDVELLLKNRYIYQFENGVIVIKHWRMANALRKDRYSPTAFKEELELLELDENNAYTFRRTDQKEEWLPSGCQVVAERLPQDSIGKDSIGKDSVDDDELLKQNNNIIENQKNITTYSNIIITEQELNKLKSELSDYCDGMPAWKFYLGYMNKQGQDRGKKYTYNDIVGWYRQDKQKGWRTFTTPSSASYDIEEWKRKSIESVPVYRKKEKK